MVGGYSVWVVLSEAIQHAEVPRRKDGRPRFVVRWSSWYLLGFADAHVELGG